MCKFFCIIHNLKSQTVAFIWITCAFQHSITYANCKIILCRLSWIWHWNKQTHLIIGVNNFCDVFDHFHWVSKTLEFIWQINYEICLLSSESSTFQPQQMRPEKILWKWFAIIASSHQIERFILSSSPWILKSTCGMVKHVNLLHQKHRTQKAKQTE